MSFVSIAFLIFLPFTAIVFYTLPHRWRWGWLLAASAVFYGFDEPLYIGLIVLVTVSAYAFSQLIDRQADPRWGKTALAASIGVCLLPLAVFKYAGFVSRSLESLSEAIGISFHAPHIDWLIPLGISFFTFRLISTLIDVYRKVLPPERHLGQFALYVAYFPQIVAGPIERARYLLPRFREEKKFNPDLFLQGLALILWGFFLKLVIADRAAIYVTAIFEKPSAASGGQVLLAAYLFSFQIYYDFAGYSNIANGASNLFGYDAVINFRRPYFSQSIREFWSRWHITLSTWFRDYIYIPLGGNRTSLPRRTLNLMTVFLICGLWHGADWTFVIWGGIHGLFLVSALILASPKERVLEASGLARFPGLIAFVNVFITFHLATFAWIFFRAGSTIDAWTLATRLLQGWHLNMGYLGDVILPFTGDNSAAAVFLTTVLFIATTVGIELALETGDNRFTRLWNASGLFRGGCLVAMAVAILFFGQFSSNTFIYRQF
jgi:alginate O-acetyltransferase complex protein AlgI